MNNEVLLHVIAKLLIAGQIPAATLANWLVAVIIAWLVGYCLGWKRVPGNV